MRRLLSVFVGLFICLSGCRPARPVAMGASENGTTEQAALVSPTDPERTHVILVNGGGRREGNYQSHLIHLKQIIELLRASKINTAHITIFSADGADPAEDLATRDLVEDQIGRAHV